MIPVLYSEEEKEEEEEEEEEITGSEEQQYFVGPIFCWPDLVPNCLQKWLISI